MSDGIHTSASARPQDGSARSPRDRLRSEAMALFKLARKVPRSATLTQEQTAALHVAIDEYVQVWRKVRLAAGLSIDGVFPPTDDPAEAMVPRDKRRAR